MDLNWTAIGLALTFLGTVGLLAYLKYRFFRTARDKSEEIALLHREIDELSAARRNDRILLLKYEEDIIKLIESNNVGNHNYTELSNNVLYVFTKTESHIANCKNVDKELDDVKRLIPPIRQRIKADHARIGKEGKDGIRGLRMRKG